ncbi:hypothetical protein ACVIHI_007798 [Bradyrhizobium sp. USDA 4524]|uniref:Uncharacterized protein n=1 Tax=Bradyrhizobium brasilense TaxID=1419277 RepID=A0A1G7EH58_9BRAD|nr:MULTISPECIES: hypothetical protein [Bradyrhizobium]MCA6100276.1 hypothetical protein [Bradyrhizobium australafricanum]MCC8976746.1 hypothetical protein [Bradyrhizobium brasilense]MCP1839288.1 hypothetical protein [Bradyrhizobium sp. USDA 4538]MCP1899852.1 hypothetical protein [Bradyrhizobium sp. USDA 4537]MCP1986039.1 hypothetical protein [Bradyrhizobium sp. USDA 4539]
MIRRLIVLTVAATALSVGQAAAQSAFPAPLPNQAGKAGTASDPAFPPVNGMRPSQAGTASDSAFPPVNGAPAARVGATPSAFPSSGAAPIAGGGLSSPPPPGAGGGGAADACMKNFTPLREDAEKRGKAIKAASDRHASPQEACKLIGNYSQAEIKMIKYVDTNAQKCGIPPQIADQLKAGHKNTEALLKKVCNVAEQAAAQPRGPAGPSLSDVLGSSASLPEATPTKKGGSTFDTLNGNVLTR